MLYKKTKNTLLFTGLMMVVADSAWASGTVNDYVVQTADNVINFPQLIAFLCYMGGFALAGLGLHAFRQHVESPGNVPLKNPLAKLGFGGVFLALPPLVSAVKGTFGGGIGSGGGSATDTVSGDGTLGGLIVEMMSNLTSLPDLVSFFGYMLGFLLTVVGVHKLKKHVDHGDNAGPLSDPLKYIAAGGMVMSLPYLSYVATNTFGSDGATQNIDAALDASGGTPGTLDDMMIRVMENAYGPVTNLFVFFCYVTGAILMLIALHRFTKTAQQGAQGPTGLGTIATFILAGVFFSIAPMVGVITETLFGNRDSMTEVAFMSLAASGADTVHARRVTIAVLAFLIVVGILSIIRGFLVLRGVAEGNQQMTMMSGISHVIAGAILVNFGQFANIIQNTLGVESYGVLFR